MRFSNQLLILFLIFIAWSTAVAEGNKEHPIRTLTQHDKELFRAIHMGGNWGRNTVSVLAPPQEYFDFLSSVNVNWVGISVALHIDDSMDSTVERKYSGVGIPTFTDENLVRAIRKLKENNFNVYLTLAFEAFEAYSAQHPVQRWQLGDPKIPNEDSNVLPEFWPWALEHPDHESFVRKFWETYTEQAVHFAEICEAEDVGLYSLGTETDRLFRTRSGGYWPNDYLEQLSSMIDSVRQVYSGLLSYDMHFSVLTALDFYSPALNHMWEDLGLDIVGISAYFPLTETMPTSVLSLDALEQRWEQIFVDHLIPLKDANPDKSILFLEFGYVDAVGSPFQPNIMEFETKTFIDADTNGLDDGEETQSNVYSAFFNVNENNSNLIEGAFLWGNDMSSDEDWANTFGLLRTFSIRQKLTEEVIKNRYENYKLPTSVHNQTNEVPTAFTLSQNYPNPFNPETTIQYQLPKTSKVKLNIYNIVGRLVSTLVEEQHAAGTYAIKWDGKDNQGQAVASGVYVYRLETTEFVRSRKLVLIR